MKTKILAVAGITAAGMLTSCDKDLVDYRQGDIRVHVKEGKEYLHDFPLFMGIKKKASPQIAMWIEDLNGNYISTIYVSHKIATGSWQANGDNRRKEALPVWCYSRGIQYPDGLYLPTKGEPVVDGISGATPHGSFDVKMTPVGNLKQFVVKIELNHSTDWNDYYPKNAKEGDSDWTGGKGGSGQPAVVYAATVDLDSDKKQYVATFMGHSSPDGTNGNINPDLSSLTSALEIVEEIIINIE